MRTEFGTITEETGEGSRGPLFNGQPVDLSLSPDAPTEAVIEALFDGDTLIDWQYDLTSWPERDKKPFHIAIAWDDHRHDPDQYAKEVHDRLLQICQGRWEVQVRWYDVSELDMGVVDLDGFNWRKFRQHVEDAGFDATHYLAVGGWGTGNCGRARAGGREAMARPNCWSETGVHELLHNGVTRHTQVIHSGTPGDEYGEFGVLMARLTGGSPRDDIATPHLIQMDVIEENNVKELVHGERGEYFFVQGSADPLSLAAGEDKAVVCMLPGVVRRLVVSYHDGTVRIHRPGYDYSTLWRQTTLLNRLDPGEGALVEGVRVEFIEAVNGAAKVQVDHHSGIDVPFPELARPQWIAPQNAHPITSLANGMWNNPAWPDSGQGVQTRFVPGGDGKPDRLVAHWMGWSRLGYKPQFRWLDAQIHDNCARGDLMGTVDGETVKMGEAIIYFYGDDLGILRAWDEDLGRFAMPLHRLGQGIEHDLNGYYGLGNSEGLSVSVMDDGQVVAFWLRHEVEPRGDTVQGWRLVQGLFGQSLTVYAVSGGMLGVPVKITRERIGSATIEDGGFQSTLEASVRTLDRMA